MKRTTKSIQAEIAKGAFRPHTALSTMALAYYQQETTSFAKNMFPVCPVQLSSDNYYVFDKEDLLRDNWNRKPAYGSVDTAVISEHTENYACHVDQMMMGIDNIRQTDLNRRQGPHTKDPRQQRTKVIATQANIHQDAEFSKSFMRKGVWKNEATGTDSVSVTSGQFIKFSNGNSDPIAFFQNKMTEINEETGRTPNRLGLGVNVYNALKEHPAILERVKYGGSTPNPAKVNLNVLAQLFEIDRIVLDRTVQNKAGLGQNADMGYIGDPNSFLLAYATDTPSVEEPSAGYIFTWDMLENGILLPILNYPGAQGTHSELVEGLMAYDMKKTADDLAFFGIRRFAMKLIAKKRCSYGGRKFFAGDEIPADIVLNVEREEKLGVISIANDEAGVPEQSGALYSQEQVDKMMADAVANASKGFTQEQVDEMIQSAVAELKPFDSDNAGFTVTVKGEGDNVTAVSCSAEDIQSVVDVLQMNADDGAKAVANVQSDSVLILLHALDTRATVKKAAQKQHDTLFSADGNSNESVGGNATTDSITEGADT
jgi:hypothetical protein